MQTKAFPLETYFMYLSDTLLDRAKILCDKNAFTLKKQDKKSGYWLFESYDPNLLETEVVTQRKQAKSYSCDCHIFQEKHICAHIAAALRLILQHKNQDKKTKKIAKSGKVKPRQLNTRALIKNVNYQDLQSFVTNYARSNADFSLKLKAQFAHTVELADNKSKYLSLIRSYSKTLGQGSFSKYALNKLHRYLENLLDLGDDLMARRNLKEANDLLHGVFEFLLVRMSIRADSQLIPIYLKTHIKIGILLEHDLAPTFANSIHIELLDLIQSYRYEIFDQTQNLYFILYQHLSKSNKVLLIDLLTTHANQARGSLVPGCTLIHLHIKEKNKQSIEEILFKYQNNYGFLQSAFQILLTERQSTLSLSIAKRLYDQANNKKLLKIIFRHIVTNKTNENNQIFWYKKHFLREKEKSIYLELKALKPTNWTSIHSTIVKKLRLEGDWKNLAFVLGEEGEKSELILLLEHLGSIEIILESLPYLSSKSSDKIEALVKAHLEQHLITHVGSKNIDHIQRVLQALRLHHYSKVAESIRRKLMISFGERTFLRKALKTM